MNCGKCNIFKKKKENDIDNDCKGIVLKDEIMKNIKENATETENIELAKIKTEFRWRVMKIPDIENEIIEISSKKYNEPRLFLNHNNEWKERDNSDQYGQYDQYEQYVIKTYYGYADH